MEITNIFNELKKKDEEKERFEQGNFENKFKNEKRIFLMKLKKLEKKLLKSSLDSFQKYILLKRVQ